MILVIALALSDILPFMPSLKVTADSVVDEIRLTSSTTSVKPGTLPEFTVSTSTEAVNDIDAGNTDWLWWGENSSSWSGFGGNIPTAVNDGKTHYGLDVCVDLKAGYSFDENTKIYFNDVEVTELGHTGIRIMSFGGYVTIDLGTAGTALTKYTISYDANGGTGTMISKKVYEGDSVQLPINTFTPPEGYSFKAWKIGNTEYDQATNYVPTGDTVVKAVWTDKYIRESRATMVPSSISGDMSPNDLVFTSLDPSKYTVSLWRVFDLTDNSLNNDNGKYPNDANFVDGHSYAIEFTFEAVGNYYEYDQMVNISTFYLNNAGTGISAATALGGSVNRRIELTAVDGSEPTFTVTYDFNGGTRQGEGTYVTHQVGYAPDISVYNFIESMGVEAPSGKELDAIEVNGVRYELGTGYMLNCDTTYRYLWKDAAPQNYTVTFKDGNETLDTRNIPSGDSVSRPEQDPAKNGFTFDDWYENAELTVPFDFNKTITSNTNIYARFTENEVQKITFRLDGATVSGNVITFEADNVIVTATVSGNGYAFDGNNLIVDLPEINTVKLALSNNFDNSKMQLKLHDGQTLIVAGNNEAIFDGLDFSQDDAPHLGLYIGNNGGGNGGENTQNYQGNATATLNYSINGAIEYTSGGGFDHGISFRINDIPYAADESKIVYSEGTAYERTGYGELVLDENGDPIVIKDPETLEPMTEKTGLTITGDTINYGYDTETNKVRFTFAMAPGTLMTGLTINGQIINDLPSTKEELEACYTDHRLEIEVDNIDKADTYNIEIEARYPNKNEEFMGNFLWDYNPQGYTGPDDKILNATMTLVEAEYNGHKYTTEEEINSLGGVYIWNDADRKKTYSDDREGVGEAQFPVGTKLTVRIVPDNGYQLVDFGINGGVFEPQEEIGTYTFVVQGGPFHLQATIEQVDDVVKTISEKIQSGNIVLGGEENAMAIGSARLDVSDINLTKEQISNFEEAASGYEINNYIDISLYNTVFKGKTTESWDTEVKDLQNEATITLKLEDGVNGDEVVIVHEKHDGTYEIIPVEYDFETNTITFKTKSFSNYAIATKTSTSNNTNNITNTNVVSSPNTFDGVFTWIILLIISLIGLVFGLLKFKKANLR